MKTIIENIFMTVLVVIGFLALIQRHPDFFIGAAALVLAIVAFIVIAYCVAIIFCRLWDWLFYDPYPHRD